MLQDFSFMSGYLILLYHCHCNGMNGSNAVEASPLSKDALLSSTMNAQEDNRCRNFINLRKVTVSEARKMNNVVKRIYLKSASKVRENKIHCRLNGVVIND